MKGQSYRMNFLAAVLVFVQLLVMVVSPAPAVAQEISVVPSPTPSGTQPAYVPEPVVTFHPAFGGFGFPSEQLGESGPSRVIYSPNGDTLVIGTPGGVYLYGAQVLRPLRFIKMDEPAISLDYSPVATVVAAGGFSGSIYLFNAQNGQFLRLLKASQSAVNALDFSPDGTMLATASSDGQVRIWRLWDGAIQRVLSGHLGAVWAVKFSPDSKLLASGGVDGSLRLWQVKDGAATRTLTGSVGGVTSLAFNPDGILVALGAGDGAVRTWNVRTGVVSVPLVEHRGGVTDVALSPDGTYLISGAYDGKMVVFNLKDGKVASTLAGPESAVISLAVAPGGKMLVSGALNGAVQVWGFPPAVSPGPVVPMCVNDAGFVADVTIPDRTVLAPGTLFYKTWRLRNSGTCPWDLTYRLEYLEGSVPGSVGSQPVPPTMPGGTADLTVPMYAPTTPGTHRSVWQMTTPGGQRFGPRVTVVIDVPAPATPTPTVTPQPLVEITADRTRINAGEWVTIRARVSRVQAAWLDGQPVVNNYAEKTVQLCETQTFTLEVVLNNGQRVSRNLTIEVTGRCTQPAARLKVEDLTANITNPQVGQSVRLSLRIRNEGDRDARGFDVVWRPSSSARYMVVASKLNLDAGDSRTVTWDYAYGSPGKFESKVRVNYDGYESRKELTLVVSPLPAPTAGNPNLDISGLAAEPLSSEVGRPVRFTVEVVNRGDGTAYGARLLWRPSQDTQFLLVEDSLNIPAGQKARSAFQYTFASPGTYNTQAVVVLGNRALADQAQEAGNSAVLQIAVKPGAVPSTNTPVPPTATPVPPTKIPVPPTATLVPPTNTPVPPADTPVPPTDTPVPPTDTPVPPTDTPVPPTDTPIPPTDTPVPPTDTPVPPTDTPVPPTDTPVPPTDTPIPPTDTPVPPTDTPIPPTDTPIPEPTAEPTQEPTPEPVELPAQAELILANLFADNTRVGMGQPVTFEVEIRNRGNAQAEGFRLLWRPAPTMAWVVVADPLSLPADAEQLLAFQYAFDAPGTYETEALVTFATPEQAEQSARPEERMKLAVAVEEAPPEGGDGGLPKLRLVLKADQKNPPVGQPVQFTVRGENKGQAPAAGVVLSFRPAEDVDYQPVGEPFNLDPGGIVEMSWTYAYPAQGDFRAEALLQNVPEQESDFVRIRVR